MTNEKSKKKITKIIWIICGLLLIGLIGIPKLYQNYHSAPYYDTTGHTIILVDKQTNKLNSYQKNQILKVAKKAVNTEDGSRNWKEYQIVSLAVSKTKKAAEYKLVLKAKLQHKSTVTAQMIVKLKQSNLLNYYNFSIKKYSSNFPQNQK